MLAFISMIHVLGSDTENNSLESGQVQVGPYVITSGSGPRPEVVRAVAAIMGVAVPAGN